jgi:Mce-associated membrane protein
MNLSVTTENDAETTEKPHPAEDSDSTANELADPGTDVVEESIADVDEAAMGSQPAVRKQRRWGRLLLAATACLLFVASLATSGFLGWQLWQKHQLEQASQQAQTAAVSYAQVLTSIDSDKVDENFSQVLDGATGEFKDMYSKSSMQLRQLLIDNKATAHGVVVDSAVQSATKNKAVVLLFVDQSVSNSNVPDPRIDRSRIKMTMEYVDGRWRASKVELP